MKVIESIVLTPVLQQLLTTEHAWYYNVVPKSFTNSEIELYADLPHFNKSLREELELILGKDVKLEYAPDEVIKKTLLQYYRKKHSDIRNNKSEFYSDHPDDFLQKLINEARSLGSSDIHIEAYEDKGRVRIRIDGMLIERYSIKKSEYPALVNKIKIKANLDIAEKRLPQDGRIFFIHDEHKFDIRVSVLPTLHGEKVVLRLLSNDATLINIDTLGFREQELNNYLEAIKKPYGIVLISGQTGSGKTTTLYATLKILNKEKSNILTIEDPIEYTLEGINQVQLKESIGLTFASALRTFLRQDPDIIMLGEIRDAETAQMAVRAALTGHLVLSTIHTNSAWGTISRLIDMGVPAYLISSTLNCTVAQRLVRLLCEHCKEERELHSSSYPPAFKPLRQLKKHFLAKGCEHCYFTGYSGRKALYEVITIDHELATNIKNHEFNIGDKLRQHSINSLAENAFSLFENGQTSLEEIYPILLNEY